MDMPEGVRRHGGKLQIRWTDPETGRRRSETLDLRQTKTGIADAVKIRKQRLLGARYGDAEGVVEEKRFESTAQLWLDQLAVKKSTRNAYRDSLNIYWGALGPRFLTTIGQRDIIALDDATNWPSEKTRNNALIPLRQFFRWALSRGYIRTENPAVALTGRRHLKTDEPDPYDREERDALLHHMERHAPFMAYVYFQLAFHTGMRTGELVGLEWRDFTGTALMVSRAIVRQEETTTKTHAARRVVLLPHTRELLSSLPRPIHGGRIITNQYGRGYQSGYHLNKPFRAAHKATGIRHRAGPYPWRSTYASIALTAGVRPALVASQLGHSLAMLLKHYARWIPSDNDLCELNKMTAADEANSRAPEVSRD